MENQIIKIESDGKNTEFYINGEKVENVKSLTFTAGAGHAPKCEYYADAFLLAFKNYK